MANATGFYTFSDPLFPPGQKIVTQLPKEIALIRIVATLFFTACVVAKIGWSWPVVILGVGFAAYTVYKHLIVKDPLVKALCSVFDNNSQEIKLDPNKSLKENIVGIEWDNLEHKNYKATTPDGRKIIIVKGESNSENRRHTQDVLAFVEKLGPYDLTSNCNRLQSILAAIGVFGLENSFSWVTGNGVTSQHRIYAQISTDMANEFFEQS